MSPARESVFGAVPAGSRLTYVWAAPLVMLGMLAASQLLPVAAAIPVIAVISAGDVPPGSAMIFGLLALAVAIIFVLFAGVAVFWIKVFERRSLASAGWRGPGGAVKYLRGLAVGFAIAAVFILLQVWLDPEGARQIASGLGELVSSPAGLVVLVVFAVMFAMQSGAEEFVFRGWMLSAIAARRGVPLGVLISGFAFAIAHIHYAFLSPLAGILAMLGVGFIGVAFAFYAVRERSVIGACAAHAAYNFSLVVMAISTRMGSEDGAQDPMRASVEAFMEATQLEEYDPSLIGGAVAAALLAVIFGFAARRRLTLGAAPA